VLLFGGELFRRENHQKGGRPRGKASLLRLPEQAWLGWVSSPPLCWQLSSPCRESPAKQGFTSGIATCFQQVKEVRTVVHPCIPLISQRGQIWIQFPLPRVPLSRTLRSFGQARCADIPLNRVAAQVQLTGNGALRLPLAMESHHLFIPREAFVSTDDLFAFNRDHVREITVSPCLWVINR